MNSSKIVHLISLVIITSLAYASGGYVPELWSNRVAVFSTASGFLTFYGVVFAVIETWRARSASELAREAARSANRRITDLTKIRNAAECQLCIKSSLQDLDKEGWVSISLLSRVIELYSAEFYAAYDQKNSPQSLAIAALQSHAISAPGPLKPKAFGRLKGTLVEMLAHVTASASARMSETEQ
ncbi:hypothetical protein [Chthonobacter albigriseus]|uniref:hypothetical protein n=1 Tax=Chthonobacter albigriseus TaxID=1683161 RepID=UPI0015EE5A6D|nr:hypothetical protein [Chthonobacter albigriseus]